MRLRATEQSSFNWFLSADDQVGGLPAPELQVDVSDSENDVDDVVPDPFPVQMKTTAVESLWSLRQDIRRAMTQSRLSVCAGGVMSSMVAVVARRISIAPDTDVVSGIYVMPDCIPAAL